MSQYKDGTVSVTNGSNVVTGSGTLWLANISAGNLFTKDGDNVAYTVASVPSNTSITLTANYGGSTSSGSDYGITIDFTSDGLPLLSVGDLNTAAIYNEAMKNISNVNSSLGTAAFSDLTSPSATIFDDGNLNYTVFPSYKATNIVIGTCYGRSVSSQAYLELPTNFVGSRASSLNITSTFKLILAGGAATSAGLVTGIGAADISLSGSRSDVVTRLTVSNLSGIIEGASYSLVTETITSEIELI